ncbi:hypothetical protein GLOIN_2v1781474 [Rhizophagus clarus]|uniref:Bromo domain-containing protein n=1 Tax=Rhizophagus clarus TaxID=94130 RepID=A0A8H3LTS7_9GLOM|nr:hypothetical protein GLOIN_2v1781474 [Rhizophagus clarus]
MLHYDTIITSTILDNWKDLNNAWVTRFMEEVEKLGLNQKALKEKENYWVGTLGNQPKLSTQINAEHLRYAKELKMFWQRVIKEHHKEENLLSTATTVTSCPKKSVKAPTKVDLSKAFQPDFHKKTNKNIEFTNFCCGILHELENKTCAHPFYKYVESNKNIKYPIDLFTINSKLKNNQYTSLSEFEEDIRQIFCNCYTYNNVEIKQKGDLKRVRDDTDTDNLSTEQNKDNLVYKQVVDNALLIASSYESLVNGDIIPFIDILKTFLLTRSRMSLSTADEPVLQAIVEYFLPLKYYIPELSLVMNAKKPKGSGRFGFSDIFVLKRIENNNYISLELKYISLNGLIKNQKNNYGANDLENLDKILEKENEETLLKRPYTYWSKEHQKTNKTTIEEILNNGIDQLKVYMNTISKGKPVNYSSSGVFDERIKTTKSGNPHKLKGFVILAVGFRRILWRSVEEVISNYIYDRI